VTTIPGVKGIGDKGAIKLLAEYGSLDGIYEHIDEISGSTGDKLRTGKDMAYLSRKLSVIVCDAPVTLELEPARVGHFDREHVTQLFHRLDFRSLLAKLPPDMRPAGAGGAVPVGCSGWERGRADVV
jgi:DNA polymerase-1